MNTMKACRLHPLAVFTAIGLSFSASAMAQKVLVNDTFDTGTTGDNGYYFNNPFPEGKNWAVVDGVVRNSNPQSTDSTLNKSFPAVTLDKVGESVTLEYSFRNRQEYDITGIFSVGLFNVGSEISFDAPGGPSPLDKKAGFRLSQQNNEQALFLDESLTDGSTISRGAWASSPTHPVPVIAGEIPFVTNSLTLTMTADGLEVSTVTDGVQMPIYLAPEVTTFTVDTISIRGPWGEGSGSRYSEVDTVLLTHEEKD